MITPISDRKISGKIQISIHKSPNRIVIPDSNTLYDNINFFYGSLHSFKSQASMFTG